MPTHTRHACSAFTLQEGLIVLGILGLLMTFLIPKLLDSNRDATYKSQLKDVLSKLEATTTQATAEGILNVGTNTVYTVVTSSLPATKVCTDAAAGGCWTSTAQGTADYQQGGLQLASGAQVSGLNTALVVATHDLLIVDADGAKGANTVGSDMLQLGICVAVAGCSATAPAGYPARQGDVFPVTGAANVALYDSLKK
jgi:type II secretory pathway pseudopilin PulG